MIKKVIKKPTVLNPISGITVQVLNILSTLILPKLVLTYFGSEVNGLISSICNFLLYVSIFEASISNIIMTAFYKPLRDNDLDSISKVYNTCDSFYNTITKIFIIYTFILGILYPFVFKTNFSFIYIFTLTIILSLSYMIQFSFSNSLRSLLKADKKVYIVNFTQAFIILLNLILAIVSIKLYPNIHFLKFISGILFIIQPIVFKYFVNKKFKINKKIGIDNQLIKSRWDGLSISIASFVHNMTDIALLTVFTKLEVVSVYSVYYLVIRGLESIMTAISNGIIPSLGNIYASNNRKVLINKFMSYELFYTFILYIIFTLAALLITPFVLLYTSNISDANYNQTVFGYIIVLGELLFLIKMPHQNLAYVANKYKEMKKVSYTEALINILISVILVIKFNLIGVAIGTTIAMLYRAIYQIYYTKKIIPELNNAKFYQMVIVYTILSIILFIFCNSIIGINSNTWLNWIISSLIFLVIIIVIYGLVIILFYKNNIKYFIKKYIIKER